MNIRHPNRPERPIKMRKYTQEERRKLAGYKNTEVKSRSYKREVREIEAEQRLS